MGTPIAGGPERWRVISVSCGGRHSLLLALPDNEPASLRSAQNSRCNSAFDSCLDQLPNGEPLSRPGSRPGTRPQSALLHSHRSAHSIAEDGDGQPIPPHYSVLTYAISFSNSPSSSTAILAFLRNVCNGQLNGNYSLHRHAVDAIATAVKSSNLKTMRIVTTMFAITWLGPIGFFCLKAALANQDQAFFDQVKQWLCSEQQHN